MLPFHSLFFHQLIKKRRRSELTCNLIKVTSRTLLSTEECIRGTMGWLRKDVLLRRKGNECVFFCKWKYILISWIKHKASTEKFLNPHMHTKWSRSWWWSWSLLTFVRENPKHVDFIPFLHFPNIFWLEFFLPNTAIAVAIAVGGCEW